MLSRAESRDDTDGHFMCWGQTTWGTGVKAGRSRKKHSQESGGSVLRSEVRSRAHLGQASQQRSRVSRHLISPNIGPVPGDKRGGTPNRAKNPGVAGDWEGQRKKASPQETTPQPRLPHSVHCEMTSVGRSTRAGGSPVPGGSTSQDTRWLGKGAMGRGEDVTLIPIPGLSPEVPTSPSKSPLGLCQWPEPL